MSTPDWQPPIPKPPHDPTSLLLDARLGWQDEHMDHVEETGDGGLALERWPDSLASLTEPAGSFGGLTAPANVALAPDGTLLLLDPVDIELRAFDPCCCEFRVVPCFGGEGTGPRQLYRPDGVRHRQHGIDICCGNLFICDTGNQRLSVFALRRFALRGHWSPPASAGMENAWKPVDVACDSRGRLYVTDPANGCIHRFSPAGRWETCFTGFGAVCFIAIDCQDRLYVTVDGVEDEVSVLTTGGTATGTASRPDRLAARFPPLPFTVDSHGVLHLGALCRPEKEPPCPQDQPAVERGLFDLSGRPVQPARGRPGLPRTATPPPFYYTQGTYYSQPLDSLLYRCPWHRVVLRGQIPEGSRVVVSTYTSETDALPGTFDELTWDTRQPSFAVDGEWDCLVRSAAGRYLWLRLEFSSNGAVTPLLCHVEIEFPRISLRRYLPAVFGAEPVSADLTDRFLSLYDTTLRSIEKEIDGLAAYFDPLSAPAERDESGTDFLTWLATWTGITLDRHWPEARRRKFLKQAGKLFDLRGTRLGLWRQLVLLMDMEAAQNCCPEDRPLDRCTPLPANCAPASDLPRAWTPPPLILEHYQLRRWLFLGAGRVGDQAMLWGKRIANRSQLDAGAQVKETQLKTVQDPYRDPFHVYAHKFSVFVPACWGGADDRRKALENLLKAESPAHTQGQIVYVAPRFRIGVQSMIGLDSVIACLPQGVTLDSAPLGVATVLTGAGQDQGGPTLEVGKEGRVGTTARLG